MATPRVTVYRTGPIKRRTAAETEQLENQILALLAKVKQSVRHVFYRMTAPTRPCSSRSPTTVTAKSNI